MERVYVLIQLHPHGGDGFSVVAVFRNYEAAHEEARAIGVDQCRVLATHLK
jgi:hypothetical protein